LKVCVQIPGGNVHDETAKHPSYRLGVLTVPDRSGVQEEGAATAAATAATADGSARAGSAHDLDLCR
jgi:hypothetical protein